MTRFSIIKHNSFTSTQLAKLYIASKEHDQVQPVNLLSCGVLPYIKQLCSRLCLKLTLAHQASDSCWVHHVLDQLVSGVRPLQEEFPMSFQFFPKKHIIPKHNIYVTSELQTIFSFLGTWETGKNCLPDEIIVYRDSACQRDYKQMVRTGSF